MASSVDVATIPLVDTASLNDAMQPWLDKFQAEVDKNNQMSAAAAAQQRSWQEAQNQIAMDFNLAEAQKNRDWQQMMSNTAHQREVADLKAAGLNPILSASGGNGAAVGSGATAQGVTSSGAKADVDTQMSGIILNLFSQFLSAQQNQQMYNATAINGMTEAIKTAQTMAGATVAAAGLSADAMRYGYDVNSKQSDINSRRDNQTKVLMQKSDLAHDIWKTGYVEGKTDARSKNSLETSLKNALISAAASVKNAETAAKATKSAARTQASGAFDREILGTLGKIAGLALFA